MTDTLDLDLVQLEALAKAATPGPWERKDGLSQRIRLIDFRYTLESSRGVVAIISGPNNCNFIVKLINAFPALLARVKAAESEREQFIEQISMLRDSELRKENQELMCLNNDLVAERDAAKAAGIAEGLERATQPGFAIVPIEPTDEMLNAAQERLCEMENYTNFNDRHQAEMFKAMVLAPSEHKQFLTEG